MYLLHEPPQWSCARPERRSSHRPDPRHRTGARPPHERDPPPRPPARTRARSFASPLGAADPRLRPVWAPIHCPAYLPRVVPGVLGRTEDRDHAVALAQQCSPVTPREADSEPKTLGICDRGLHLLLCMTRAGHPQHHTPTVNICSRQGMLSQRGRPLPALGLGERGRIKHCSTSGRGEGLVGAGVTQTACIDHCSQRGLDTRSNAASPSELKSGPGRTRTSDTRFRKPLLCPLSYGAAHGHPSSDGPLGRLHAALRRAPTARPTAPRPRTAA
jgi:hypothetical protein